MLTIVTRRKQVKGQDNLEQQLAELKEVFAVYDEDGTGQLEQAEFVEAILSAGPACRIFTCMLDESTWATMHTMQRSINGLCIKSAYHHPLCLYTLFLLVC